MKIPYVSPSRLKKILDCDFKYYLSYEWGWSDELFTYAWCSAFGSSVHNTLEAYANAKGELDYVQEYAKQTAELKPFVDDMNKAPSKARAAFFIDKLCENCKHFDSSISYCKLMDQPINDFDGCPANLYTQGLTMIETAIDRYGDYFDTGIKSLDNPDGKVIGVEAPADIIWGVDKDGEDIKMHGFIDLVLEYDKDTLLVVDYKTGYSIPTHEAFIKDLQPRMYSYAAKQLYPNYKYYWVQFDYFRGIPIEHVFTADDDEITRKEVIKYYHYIKGAREIKRRAYDHKCKYLCNRPFCDKKWEEFKLGVDGSNPDYKPEDHR